MAASSSLPSWRHRLAEPPLRSTLLQVVLASGDVRVSSVFVCAGPGLCLGASSLYPPLLPCGSLACVGGVRSLFFFLHSF
jgi:hypothetical protein